MTKQDLQQIGQLMDEKLAANKADLIVELDQRMGQKLTATKKDIAIEVDQKLNQRFNKIDRRFEEIDERFKTSEENIIEKLIGYFGQFVEDNIIPQFEALHGKIAQLPTKGYLDEKINNALAGHTLRLRHEDEKVDRLIGTLHRNKCLTKRDLSHIDQLEIFPKIPG